MQLLTRSRVIWNGVAALLVGKLFVMPSLQQQQQQQQQETTAMTTNRLCATSPRSSSNDESTTTSFSVDCSVTTNSPPHYEYRAPPDVNYTENPTVFGKILRGEAPANVLEETSNVLVFMDRKPRAPLHALVIPKRYIPTVKDLKQQSNDNNDLELVKEMQREGLKLIQKRYPRAYKTNDYILGFHVPPFNSVNHLHLHVLAPASQMKPIYRYGKYLVNTWWCLSVTQVLEHLEENTI